MKNSGGSAISRSFWLARLNRACAVVETVTPLVSTTWAGALTFICAYWMS